MHGSNAHAVTLSRLLVVTLMLLILFLIRDVWLPNGSLPSSRTDFNASPILHTESEEDLRENDPFQPQQPSAAEVCGDAPGANNVMVMLKTGATELYQKLPTHFVTTFKCVPHFMIFSDLAQEIADYPVYDAIASVSKQLRDDHPDLELYRQLQQYQSSGQDTSNLQGVNGWNLDKWKFLPMMHHAFADAGDEMEWFVIIEADTSLSWTNLLQWLRRMDPRQPIYSGAQNLIGTTNFAHGGSGIVISRQAANLLEQARDKEGSQAFDDRWEQLTSTSCCGDEVIARAFLEVGVHLNLAWPLIQGETVASLDWTANHWCTPAVSWHHVSPTELDALWRFESAWVSDYGWNTPYLYRDVFAHFIDRHITVNRTKWNNLSQDHKFVSAELVTLEDNESPPLKDFELKAAESKEACVAACLRMPESECLQWMYSSGRCYLGKVVRFGQSDEREKDHWTSGWIQGRLERFKGGFDGCTVRWPG